MPEPFGVGEVQRAGQRDAQHLTGGVARDREAVQDDCGGHPLTSAIAGARGALAGGSVTLTDASNLPAEPAPSGKAVNSAD
ncbi:hypothetical protein GCM10009530_76430 [Microbispora corallina]|uniref:Uncharacterized protein n=1 Tax=Microbispora corallina TaxID=83302 RepID=A0ABQ4GBP5_9ACTN|nr:hypothetical protein Mco01_75090 [Microbispora corallina]